MADETRVPIYKILSNDAIESIATILPTNLDQLGEVNGIGPVKLKKYGQRILQIVRSTELGEIQLDSIQIPEKKGTKKLSKRSKTLSPEAVANLNVPPITFSDLDNERQLVATRVINGSSMFITGSAGTGKSFLLKYIIENLQKKHGEQAVVVTGPTGLAAINIGGQTIHSFAGLGLHRNDTNSMIKKVLGDKAAVQRWTSCKVLIIDEISMVDAQLFELLDLLGKNTKRNNQPFGGMQVVVVGDFMQLPPVLKGEAQQFCFETKAWSDCGFSTSSGSHQLTTVMRQESEAFIRILNEIREGKMSAEASSLLEGCLIVNKPLPASGIVPTKIYCVNKEVDEVNAQQLAALPGEVRTMIAEDSWKELPTRNSTRNALLSNAEKLIPAKIDLKVGAQVMLLRNRLNQFPSRASGKSDAGKDNYPQLVNGSRGKIVGFVESSMQPGLWIPKVQFDNGIVAVIGPVDFVYAAPDRSNLIVRSQVPLRLAWATTVHKSQGCTLTCAELMLANSFDFGQVYVALSRVRSLDGLWLSRRIQPKSVKVHPKAMQFYKTLNFTVA